MSALHAADWNGLDWILVAILLLSTLRAWLRGLLRALFGLLGFVGGFVLASYYHEAAGDWIFQRQWLSSLPTARIVAFLVIVVAVVIAFELAGHAVRKVAHAVGLGTFDRLLGACFGLARGLLLGVVVIVGTIAFAPQSSWMTGSKLAPYFLGAAHAVSFGVPHELP
jgi:membrane protein required for colicin V production